MRIGINGLGRVGRQVLKIALERGLEVAGANDIVPADTIAHLIKYDSVFGKWDRDIRAEEGALVVDGAKIPYTSHRDPSEIPWGDWGVDLVIEASGVFRSRDKAALHLRDTVKKVIITAPGKGEPPDITIVMGSNEEAYDPEKHQVISNASCTTNALATMVKVLLDEFGIEWGMVTTVHSYTNDQRILDAPHRDLRRARAAALSMIPTSTGAAKAISLIFPQLAGKMTAVALRVPTPDVSVVDLVVGLAKDASPEEVNRAFREAAEGKLARYLAYTEEPLVSVDFIGDPHSVIVDGSLTQAVGRRTFKVFGWYDNEWGYSERVVDLAQYIASRGL